MPSRYWWRFAQALGWVNARVLLTLLFALVLTPVGVVAPPSVSAVPAEAPPPSRRRGFWERLFGRGER